MASSLLPHFPSAQGKDAFIRKYCNQSRPKLGWEGEHQLNHFRLLELIYNNEFHITKAEMQKLFEERMLYEMQDFVRSHFSIFFTPLRIELINLCLEYRYNEIKKLLI